MRLSVVFIVVEALLVTLVVFGTPAIAQAVTTISYTTTATVPLTTTTGTYTISQAGTTTTTTTTYTSSGSTYATTYTSYTGTTATIITSYSTVPGTTITYTFALTQTGYTVTTTATYTYGGNTVTGVVTAISTIGAGPGQSTGVTTQVTTLGGGGISPGVEIVLLGTSLAIIGGIVVYRIVYGKKKKPPPVPTTTPVTPGSTPVSNKPPVEVPPIIPVPVLYGKDVKEGCVLGYEWLHHSMNVTVSVDGQNYSTAPHVPGTQAVRYTIGARDYVPLRAESFDVHVLVQKCACPGIDGDSSIKLHKVLANVRYQWEIVEGEGNFYPEGKTTNGQQVIFMPPEVKLPVQKVKTPPGELPIQSLVTEPDQSSDEKQLKKKVRMRITALHDDPTKPPVQHESVHVELVLEITREKATETVSRPLVMKPEREFSYTKTNDQYVYDWWRVGVGSIEAPTLPKERSGACVPEFEWQDAKPIEGAISPKYDCLPGALVLLEAEGSDTDTLQLKCIPTGGVCKVPAFSRVDMSDIVYYEWKSEKGGFANGNAPDREAVWRAPLEYGKVKITLRLYNARGRAGGVSVEVVDEPKVLETSIEVLKPSVLRFGAPGEPPVPQTVGEILAPKSSIKDCSQLKAAYDKALADFEDRKESRKWIHGVPYDDMVQEEYEKAKTALEKAAVAYADCLGIGPSEFLRVTDDEPHHQKYDETNTMVQGQ